jgi:pimeloyl-ACP methyl ester carboxylesterase
LSNYLLVMEFQTKSVVSKDGTLISYKQTGNGPGLVICHGGGRASQHYEQLATALADSFTVFIPDRRGREGSGPITEDYSIIKACEDLEAMLKTTGATFVFGHSAGALIVLETSLVYPVEKVTVYDPPVSVNGSVPVDWLPEFEKMVAKGKKIDAMLVVLKSLKMNDGISMLPKWVLKPLLYLLIKKKKNGQEWEIRLDEFLHTLPPDIKMVKALDSKIERYAAVKAEVLLLCGSKTPDYLQQAIRNLSAVIPNNKVIVFDGLDHAAPEENAAAIAPDLKRFFS